jgi:hypothetical protein
MGSDDIADGATPHSRTGSICGRADIDERLFAFQMLRLRGPVNPIYVTVTEQW